MIVIGLDVHKQSVTAVAVDEAGRPLGEKVVIVGSDELLGWAAALSDQRFTAASHGTVGGTVSGSAAGHEEPLASVAIGRMLRCRSRRSGTYLLRLTPKVRGHGSYALDYRWR